MRTVVADVVHENFARLVEAARHKDVLFCIIAQRPNILSVRLEACDNLHSIRAKATLATLAIGLIRPSWRCHEGVHAQKSHVQKHHSILHVQQRDRCKQTAGAASRLACKDA